MKRNEEFVIFNILKNFKI